MAVVINEFEVAPAPAAAPSTAQPAQSADQGKQDDMRKVEKLMRLDRERQRRLAAY